MKTNDIKAGSYYLLKMAPDHFGDTGRTLHIGKCITPGKKDQYDNMFTVYGQDDEDEHVIYSREVVQLLNQKLMFLIEL